MPENVKLRPCPFCGGSAGFIPDIMASQSNMLGWRFYVACFRCGVSYKNKDWRVWIKFDSDGNIVFARDDRPEALALWNASGDDGTDVVDG